jgi:hypothetical protein
VAKKNVSFSLLKEKQMGTEGVYFRLACFSSTSSLKKSANATRSTSDITEVTPQILSQS